MDNLARLKLRTEEVDETVLQDCLESAKSAIMARRYPFQEDLQFRCALDLYNRIGAEGQLGHTENSISRTWESAWISESLLQEVTPLAGRVT